MIKLANIDEENMYFNFIFLKGNNTINHLTMNFILPLLYNILKS